MKKIPERTLETAWLIAAILALLAGFHKTWYQGLTNSYGFFLIFLLSLLMFLNRRNNRKSK